MMGRARLISARLGDSGDSAAGDAGRLISAATRSIPPPRSMPPAGQCRPGCLPCAVPPLPAGARDTPARAPQPRRIFSRTMSFSPLISVSMVSGEASAVLIRSLFKTMVLPLSRVSSIIVSYSFMQVIGSIGERLKNRIKLNAAEVSADRTDTPGYDKVRTSRAEEGARCGGYQPEAATQGT